MSEPKLISPLLDNFLMGDPISDHHGVRCCPAIIKDTDNRFIVKIISIPASQVQLDALLLAGAYSSQASALAYFKELAAGVAEEAEILKKLSKFEGFVPYDGLQVVPMEGKVGYDVYLLSPYKRSLERQLRQGPLTHLKAVNLGLDLCASMVMCRRAGFLYVDLKPGNIFINTKNEFCVGDLGFIRLSSLKYASLPDKYRSAYTAPELSDAMAAMNETVDTYAIGMILYQVFNDNRLPEVPAAGESYPAPVHADREMTEIILKAIAADPAERWQDPMTMGQALVAYMQRNSVNDIPIGQSIPEEEPVPEPETPTEPEQIPEESAPAEEAPAEEVPVEEVAEAEQPQPAEPETEQEIIPAAVPAEEASEESPAEEPVQEEAPETEVPAEQVPVAEVEDPEDIDYEELSDETSDILAQADELLAMEVPEPVVAPEPVEIPMPEPIVLEEEADEEIPEETTPQETPELVPEETPDVDEPQSEPEPVPEPEPEPEPAPVEESAALPAKKPIPVGKIVTAAIVILLLLGLFAGGYYYYNHIYIQTVDTLELQGQENSLTVLVDTDADESLLTVVCSDSYGSSRTAALENGKAVFDNLNPDTIYKITVQINGFHSLTGDVTDTYTTPAQTNILQFDATAGNESGSVILTFAVDGQDTKNWTVTYTAEGENEQTVTFSGHIVTVNGLTPGKEYTFTLSSTDSLYIVGKDTVTFTASAPVYAQNLTITKCTSEGLTAVWNAPEDTVVEKWIVRCYSDGGYDRTIETGDLTVTFTDLDPSQAFTVEVIADGMSMGVRTYLSARSATITGSTADTSVPLTLTVTWEFTGTAPEGGWLVIYNREGSQRQEIIQTTQNTVTIYPTLPNSTYEFTVQSADGTTVVDGSFTGKTGGISVFSGYGVTADNMNFQMCKTPGYSDWHWYDVPNAFYKYTYAPGEKASVVVSMNRSYEVSYDVIEVLFIIRDESGDMVCSSSVSSSWSTMWNQGYCELDIGSMPTEPGQYTLAVYFNGMAASQVSFSIQ